MVIKRTFGADIGYSSGKNSSNLNTPPSNGDYKNHQKKNSISKQQQLTPSGPATTTWKYRALLSSGTADIPGTGSAISRCVSLSEKNVKFKNPKCKKNSYLDDTSR